MPKKKAKKSQSLDVVAVLGLLAAAYFVNEVISALSAEPIYIVSGLTGIINAFPDKWSFGLVIVSVAWTYISAGRLRLINAFTLGMTLASAAIWLFLV